MYSHKKWNEMLFKVAQVEIESLRTQAASGEIILAYVDEAGFWQVHPNRSAWTPGLDRRLIYVLPTRQQAYRDHGINYTTMCEAKNAPRGIKQLKSIGK
jgi:hypothetical protein